MVNVHCVLHLTGVMPYPSSAIEKSTSPTGNLRWRTSDWKATSAFPVQSDQVNYCSSNWSDKSAWFGCWVGITQLGLWSSDIVIYIQLMNFEGLLFLSFTLLFSHNVDCRPGIQTDYECFKYLRRPPAGDATILLLLSRIS